MVNWSSIAYGLACVVVPLAWGLMVVAVSNRLDRRLVKPDGSGKRPRPIEYHI